MKEKLKYLVLFVCVLLTGCASAHQYVAFPNQQVSVEDTSKARIYVVRPSFMGTAISMHVNDHEQEIGKTGSKSFLCWERLPGEVDILSTSENTAQLKFDALAGQVYYVLQEPAPGWVTMRNEISIIDENRAQKYLKKCKPPKLVVK